MRSRRQQQKRKKDIFAIIGITALFTLAGGGYYLFNSYSDPLDANNCSIKMDLMVTAIVFDKSQMYSVEQVTDIQTSFESWLTGKEVKTKSRPINLDFFDEGTLQLYVTDNKDVNAVGGLVPLVELWFQRILECNSDTES